ncbi:MAG: 3'(2'),5'-bisphosphate nucleotidase CysQ, partial [Gammaproteobacteria bacterium]|nr:3'(2'),5'-bisphosphate nucleotidase CysQ [Gammaproteobacteria bacterium]
MTPDQNLLEKVIQLSQRAGAAIMQVYARDFSVETKQDTSPLTEADLAAHALIVQGLGDITPHIPVLSEES